MSDLISRQAAIDVLAEMQGRCTTKAALIQNSKIWQQIKDLPSAEPRWIPVAERLPEPVAPSQRRGWFLTSNQYGSVTLTCYEFETSPFREGWQTDMTILAWMPLPEPYKRSEDAEID